MLKIENVTTTGWEPAIYSMRNPKNSWSRSDSYHNYHEMVDGEDDTCDYVLGANDLKLATTLANAGTEHGKFLRMINVYFDVVAPLYWIAELDTYKVGTVRNSCSFMHKGVSKPFTISDFSIKNEKVYEVLNDIKRKEHKITYPYETDEYKEYLDVYGNGYKVYRNGKIVAKEFDYVDNYGTGRARHFDEREMKPWSNKDGYWRVKLVGRNHGHMLVHRMVAEAWQLPRNENQTQVDHINTDKGDNSVENLQWVTPSENMQRAIKNGLYDNLNSMHKKYKTWKSGFRIPLEKRMSFLIDCKAGFVHKELAEKYNITPSQANSMRYEIEKHLEEEYLFSECYI